MRHGLALLLALQVSVPTAASPQWPAVPWPTDVTPQVISEDMRFNGQAVRLYRFDRRGDPSTMAGQFEDALGKHARVTVVGERHIVAAPLAHTFVTIDLHPKGDGTVAGHVMQTHFQMPPSKTPPAMPLESRLWNHTESRDGPNTAATFMLENLHSAMANTEFYRRHFASQGLSRKASRNAHSPHNATTTHFAGRGQSAVVLVEDWGAFRTVIVHHTREFP
jgi:hypothetical protein